MTNNKLLSLAAVALILASCVFLAGSSASPLTHNGDVAYTPLANDLPFPFETATPTPTATPVPTVTPVPTPRPEPAAKPAIDIYCRTSAAASSLKVQVTGTLSYNKTGIANATVYLGYSADSGINWQNYTLVQTHNDGSYGAVWIPNGTGSYLMCASWEGNNTLHWMNATATLAVTSDSAGSVFSVVTNSTLSNFAYDSASQVLSFNTNGTSKTAYVYACIPKTLVSDIQTVQLSIDGKSTAFTSESQDDVWVISCVYSQSEHAFNIQVPLAQILSPQSTPWIPIVIVIAVLIAVIAVVVVIRRRRRTAATVAAILKQDRPVY